TGEVIRQEIARGTELGRSMQSYIEAGQLAPDSIVIGMIRNYMTEHKDAAGNIFDGFPRTTAQAEEFDRILAEDGLSVSVMVYMDVPEQELVDRILLRGKDSGRADDASEDVIRNRIAVYREQTEIVADHYSKQGKYVAVDGLGTMDEVFDRICKVIDEKK
ncbi:MAG: adenylate kinase, partial [Alistipes sp.]|nr:adenylate kinase [Alistipes sp.]